MRRILSLVIAFGTVASIAAFLSHTSQRAAAQEAAPIYGVTLPPGYRDWTLISVARVGGQQNDLRAKLGNEVAIKAYREGKTQFPDGTIIARLAWKQTTSEENTKVVRTIFEKGSTSEVVQSLLTESFIAGPPTNVQFMVKDSKRYASTGAGALLNLPMASLTERRCTRLAFPAMSRPKIATLYSPVTHLNKGTR